jgi:hypothetical protein
VDNCRNSAKFPATMKSDALTGILTFVLGALVLLGVVFALKVVVITRESRLLMHEASQEATVIAQTQQLFNEAAAYNQKYQSPDLTRILQSMQTRPATH